MATCLSTSLLTLPRLVSTQELQRLLIDFNWLWAKLRATRRQRAVSLTTRLIRSSSPTPTCGWSRRQCACRAHVLARDPTQLPGQLVGRLLTYQQPVIQGLLTQVRVWHGQRLGLCPCFPSLTPAWRTALAYSEGHTDEVTAVAVAEGRVVSGGSADETLRMWDLASGQSLQVAEGHMGWVTAVAVAEGRVVSGSVDETLRVWDLASGLVVSTSFEGHTEIGDGGSGGRGAGGLRLRPTETLRVWDLASGRCPHVLEGHTDEVTAVAVAEGRVVSGSRDQTLRVWDLASGQCPDVLEGRAPVPG